MFQFLVNKRIIVLFFTFSYLHRIIYRKGQLQKLVNEEIVVAQAKNGDRKAFSLLVREHQKFAYNLAFRLVGNEEDTKDIVQDSFVKIWKNISSFDINTKFSTWMYKIVTNTAIDLIRKSRSIIQEDHLLHENLLQSSENPEVSLTNKELSGLLAVATAKLPVKQKAIFILKDLQGQSSEEICLIMGQTPDKVKSNLYHARKSVRLEMLKFINYEKNE